MVFKQSQAGGQTLEQLSQRVEDSVYNLTWVFAKYDDQAEDFSLDIRKQVNAPIETESLRSGIEEQEDSPFVTNCKEVINFFRLKCIEKIIICLKLSLESIKKRILSSKMATQKEAITPLFSIDINLAIPNVALSPPLDELQQVLNKAARFIVEASKEVKAWGQHRVHMVEHEDDAGNIIENIETIQMEHLESWYANIKNSKDIARVVKLSIRPCENFLKSQNFKQKSTFRKILENQNLDFLFSKKY